MNATLRAVAPRCNPPGGPRRRPEMSEPKVEPPVDQPRPSDRRSSGRFRRLRIVVHDYGGYPFIVQLSRALADRGHHVLHLYAEGFRRPKGPVEVAPGDPPTLSLEPVRLSEAPHPAGYQRILQERRYGRQLAERIASLNADVVISANSPLYVQASIQDAAHSTGAAFAFWVQDLHSVAIARIIGRRVRMLGVLIGTRFARLERRLLRESEAIIVISADFLPVFREWGVATDVVEVIENWAPLTDPPLLGKANSWAIEHGLLNRSVVLYAGTLALKHNPALLLELARGLSDVTVVAVAEGAGADWLRAHGQASRNLLVLPLEPYSRLSEVLASADLLLAVLEPDASTFSAPSKVLTYLAAGKPILAAVTGDNAAARAILRAGAGVVVDPTDVAGLVAAARQLLDNPARLRSAGAAGLAYARDTFDIGRISERFEAAIYDAVNRKSPSRLSVAIDTGPATDASHGRTPEDTQ